MVWMGMKMDVVDVEECLSIVWNLWNVRNNFIFEKPE